MLICGGAAGRRRAYSCRGYIVRLLAQLVTEVLHMRLLLARFRGKSGGTRERRDSDPSSPRAAVAPLPLPPLTLM